MGGAKREGWVVRGGGAAKSGGREGQERRTDEGEYAQTEKREGPQA